MDILFDILFWIHLVALVGGGASGVAMPAIGAQMPGATPDARERLQKVAKRLMMGSRGAVAALIITGPLMFWMRYDFVAPDNTWFAIKMVLVVILIVCMVVSGIATKKAMAGDAAAQKRATLAGQLSGVSLLLIILAAVFAFG
jgi:uncharacterized membrane protein